VIGELVAEAGESNAELVSAESKVEELIGEEVG
jgi:hypothetical protein